MDKPLATFQHSVAAAKISNYTLKISSGEHCEGTGAHGHNGISCAPTIKEHTNVSEETTSEYGSNHMSTTFSDFNLAR
jgi:hypothetical protein